MSEEIRQLLPLIQRMQDMNTDTAARLFGTQLLVQCLLPLMVGRLRGDPDPREFLSTLESEIEKVLARQHATGDEAFDRVWVDTAREQANMALRHAAAALGIMDPN
ncbi:MAG: hypothetical protein AB7I36_01945 [Rhodospirillaceae bacterium]